MGVKVVPPFGHALRDLGEEWLQRPVVKFGGGL